MTYRYMVRSATFDAPVPIYKQHVVRSPSRVYRLVTYSASAARHSSVCRRSLQEGHREQQALECKPHTQACGKTRLGVLLHVKAPPYSRSPARTRRRPGARCQSRPPCRGSQKQADFGISPG